ncbi:transcription factor S [Candidatus Woesearchaeota archaeon]|nr:transcription factor S [Candidatus Woesearchaeota archaeon]
MEFCPKCGSLVVPKSGGRKTKSFACECGHRIKQKPTTVLKETVALEKKDEITVIDRNVEMLPQTDEECPKCKNKKAYFWTVQTRAGDEAETRFLECTKCKHRWRSYS